MAFGIFNDAGSGFAPLFLILSTLGVAAVIIFWIWKSREKDSITAFGLSLILGGAMGNFVDRIRLGEVIDFLDFYVGSYHWPAFNVADSAITVGTLWVAIRLFRRADKQGPDKNEGGWVAIRLFRRADKQGPDKNEGGPHEMGQRP
ncbi:MAG: signal peptidase II [Deltaproteobacteria bacterium]|nr:signal peptidase II [Deltaproteobacteria bacterium]